MPDAGDQARRAEDQARASAHSGSLPDASIDQPSPGAILSGPLRVSGWAATTAGPCVRVELSLDGRSLGPGRLGAYRPDVALATGMPTAALSGFELLLDLSDGGTVGRRQGELGG